MEDLGTAQETRFLEPSERPIAIRASDALRGFVDLVGRWASWLFVPLIVVTVFDVTARKLVWIQLWLVEHFGRIFESTLLQELEWHFHTALFALVLGYGYIWNTHVRVDLVRENLAFRKKAWLELIGLTVFMIPFCLVVIWFSLIYAYDSWFIGEISASQVGLSHRWIIKSVLVFGLVVAAISGIAVWLQVAIVLWGPQSLRLVRIAKLEDHAVGHAPGHGQGHRSVAGDPHRELRFAGPGELQLGALVGDGAALDEVADHPDRLLRIGERDRRLAEEAPGRVAAPDAEVHPSAAHLVEGREARGGHGRLARARIRDAGAEAERGRVLGDEREERVRIAPQDVRVEQPQVVEPYRLAELCELDRSLDRVLRFERESELHLANPRVKR
jgi:TRAP-type mannitol/chloroaromatic compound transport system permease small subunit